MSKRNVRPHRKQDNDLPPDVPSVEERIRAARNLLSIVGRQERRRRGEPELQVVNGGEGRAA